MNDEFTGIKAMEEKFVFRIPPFLTHTMISCVNKLSASFYSVNRNYDNPIKIEEFAEEFKKYIINVYKEKYIK